MKQNMTYIIREAFLDRVPKDGVKTDSSHVKRQLLHLGLTDDVFMQSMRQYPATDIRFYGRGVRYTLRVVHQGRVIWLDFQAEKDQQGIRFVAKAIRL